MLAIDDLFSAIYIGFFRHSGPSISIWSANSERTLKALPAVMFAIRVKKMTSAIMSGALVSSGTVINAANGD